MITNSVGRTTGFVTNRHKTGGYWSSLTMSNEEETSRALAERPHYISGKLVSTHLKGQDFTLHLYDLPNNTTDKDLYETFSKFGKLVHWEVMPSLRNKMNQTFTNGYVSFSSAEEVDRVMERQLSINGTLLTIQRQLWKGRTKKH